MKLIKNLKRNSSLHFFLGVIVLNKAELNGTLVKADIVNLVYEKVGFTRQEAAQAVDILFEEIKKRLGQG